MFRSIVFSIVLASSAVAYNWNGRGGHPYIPPAPPSDKSKAEAPKAAKKTTKYGRPSHLEGNWLGQIHAPTQVYTTPGWAHQDEGMKAKGPLEGSEWLTGPYTPGVGVGTNPRSGPGRGASSTAEPPAHFGSGGAYGGNMRQLEGQGASVEAASSSADAYSAAWLHSQPLTPTGTLPSAVPSSPALPPASSSSSSQASAYGSRRQLDNSPNIEDKPWSAAWVSSPPLSNVGTAPRGHQQSGQMMPSGGNYGSKQLDGATKQGENSYAAAWLTSAPGTGVGTTKRDQSAYGNTYGNRHLDASAPMKEKPWAAEWTGAYQPGTGVGTNNAPSTYNSGYGNRHLDGSAPQSGAAWAAEWTGAYQPGAGVGTNGARGARSTAAAPAAPSASAPSAPWMAAPAPAAAPAAPSSGGASPGQNYGPGAGYSPQRAQQQQSAPAGYAPPAQAYAPPAPAAAPAASSGGPHLGSGGMADTRDPDAFQHEDARKSISVAPSFEEYMKQRS